MQAPVESMRKMGEFRELLKIIIYVLRVVTTTVLYRELDHYPKTKTHGILWKKSCTVVP